MSLSEPLNKYLERTYYVHVDVKLLTLGAGTADHC